VVERGGGPGSLPDYLWGIETIVVCKLSTCYVGFQTTYEELKLSSGRFPPFSPKASRLPMRNWNPSEKWRRPECTRFQTTYEELKQRLTVSYNQPYKASRLPMRNWNSWGVDYTANRPDSFQTTYEELKRIDVSGWSTLNVFASRLPMRNWNFARDMIHRQNTNASRLPMRNWNRDGQYNNSGFYASRLPMRNWNVRTGAEVETLARFQTTYEELKPHFCNWIVYIPASRLPMRNWNLQCHS